MSKKPKRIADARLLAFEVLVAVELEGAYSNLILPKVLTESALDLKDRAFATELVYGTLRMRGRHDHFIASASDRFLEQIDPKALIVLRLGAHQLKEMRVPSHAAIFETVELAKKVVGKSTASCLVISKQAFEDGPLMPLNWFFLLFMRSASSSRTNSQVPFDFY